MIKLLPFSSNLPRGKKYFRSRRDALTRKILDLQCHLLSKRRRKSLKYVELLHSESKWWGETLRVESELLCLQSSLLSDLVNIISALSVLSGRLWQGNQIEPQTLTPSFKFYDCTNTLSYPMFLLGTSQSSGHGGRPFLFIKLSFLAFKKQGVGSLLPSFWWLSSLPSICPQQIWYSLPLATI